MTVYGSKTTEFGESPPETLAWLMMLEIVREETARRCCGPPPSVDCGGTASRTARICSGLGVDFLAQPMGTVRVTLMPPRRVPARQV